MASNAAPFVQRGFNLPNYGINPSILSGIPEQQQQHDVHHSGSGSMSPAAFVAPQFRSWNSPGSGDELTEALQSFINLDGDAHLPTASKSPQSMQNPPLSPSARGSVFDFHGYKALSQQQQQNPERPSFLRDNSSSSAVLQHQQYPHMQQQPPDAGSSNTPRSPIGVGTTAHNATRPNIVNGSTDSFDISTSILNQSSRSFANAFSPTGSFGTGLPSPSLVDTPIEEEGSSKRSTSRSGRTTSPNDDKGRGRTASTGKAPVQRPSRSRTRQPSYSRTISPGQNALRNSTGSNASGNGGVNGIPAVTIPVARSGSIVSGTSSAATTPYMPGYPLPNASVNAQRYGVSVPTYLSGSADKPSWMKTGIQPNPLQQQQAQQASNGGYSFASLQHQQHQRRMSEASAFSPSSFGASEISPSFRSIPLPGMDMHQPSPHSATGMASIPSSAPAGYNFAISASPHEELEDIKEESNGKTGKDDKRKKRRESHNAVERRRRDNINDRITELARLIPEVLLDPAAAGISNNDKDEPSPTGTSQQAGLNGLAGSPPLPTSTAAFTPAQLAQQQSSSRPNKGIILTKSVEYIYYLQQLVRVQAERNNELEQRVKLLESSNQSGAGMFAAFPDNGGPSTGIANAHSNGSRSGSLPSNASSASSGGGNKSGSTSSASPNSLLGLNSHQLPTVEERLMEEHQMTFEDLLGMSNQSPAKVEDDEDAMMGE